MQIDIFLGLIFRACKSFNTTSVFSKVFYYLNLTVYTFVAVLFLFSDLSQQQANQNSTGNNTYSLFLLLLLLFLIMYIRLKRKNQTVFLHIDPSDNFSQIKQRVGVLFRKEQNEIMLFASDKVVHEILALLRMFVCPLTYRCLLLACL